MRLTNVLQHGKRFWWGKGWGNKPRKDKDPYLFSKQWKKGHQRPLEVIEQKLPEGVTPVEPNSYLKKELFKEMYGEQKPFVLPWPYSKRPVKGKPVKVVVAYYRCFN